MATDEFTQPPERKPLYRCRRITHVEMDESATDILSALQSGELQAYTIYRYDNGTTTNAVYHPTRHLLMLFHDERTEAAKDIPSMYLGLKWWIQEPEIWKEHIVSNEC